MTVPADSVLPNTRRLRNETESRRHPNGGRFIHPSWRLGDFDVENLVVAGNAQAYWNLTIMRDTNGYLRTVVYIANRSRVNKGELLPY